VELTGGVWQLAREYASIAEAGGVKDVVAGLARSIAAAGIPSTVVLPRYGFVDLAALKARRLPLAFDIGLPRENGPSPAAPERVEVYACEQDGVRIFLLDSPRTRSKRAVYTYRQEDEGEDPYKLKGSGHWDAHHLNMIVQRGALHLARLLAEKPAVLHCHDGHCGLVPALLAESPQERGWFASTRALLTIHNAGAGYHQEIYGLEYAGQLTGLPAAVLRRGLAGEAVDPLLVGALYAPVNTVSEGYAREILSGELDELTGGLGRWYRDRRIPLAGITNGIDPLPFDPRRPERTGLGHGFDPVRNEMAGKERIRAELLALLAAGRSPGVEMHGALGGEEAGPLYTFIGRLTRQKGVDLLIAALSLLFSRRAGFRMVILGEGESGIEGSLISLCRELPARGRMALLLGYSGEIAKMVYAAGDFFLVPSLYEPCGLTDFFAQMMGNLPVVHRVGGLAKVEHGVTGYSYAEQTLDGLSGAILESLADYRERPELLARMRRQAVGRIYDRYTWEKVLERHYLPLYAGLAPGPAAGA
jgi:starch synthase